MRPLHPDLAKYICSKFGYDVVIIYARKNGLGGGEALAHAGSSYQNKRVGDEMVEFLKSQVFGWREEAPPDPEQNVLGMPILDEGPQGGDPHMGHKIIVGALDKKGRK